MSQKSIIGLTGPAQAALAAFIFAVTPATAGASEAAPHTAPAGAHAVPAGAGHASPAAPIAGGDHATVSSADHGNASEAAHAGAADITFGGSSVDEAAGPESYDQSYDPDAAYAAAEAAAAADPWTRWLVALEQTAGDHQAGGHAEGNLLFPLDARLSDESPAQPYRHLAIARAVGELEARPERRKSGPGSEEEGHGAAGSPLLALANARNYLNLSEYDKALEWYRQVAVRDGDGHFRRETGRETLVAAICGRDTVAAGLAIAATLAAPDYSGRESEVVLAFRWLLNRRDTAALDWLLQRTTAPEAAADERITFWRAYTFSWLDRRAECLTELRMLLTMGGQGRTLGDRERGWVLTATADLLLLEGATDEAAGRYARLADSSVAGLRQWGRLQSAGLAFLAHRYGEAGAGFREICQSDAQGTWGPHACAMADIAGKLDKLLSEGERYGADAQYRH